MNNKETKMLISKVFPEILRIVKEGKLDKGDIEMMKGIGEILLKAKLPPGPEAAKGSEDE